MIDFFYNIKFSIGCNKVCSLWNHIVNWIFAHLFPIYCGIKKPVNGLNHQKRDEKIIISLTSFPARFDAVYYAVRALLLQTVKPDHIFLWLIEVECRNVEIPQRLLELEKYGLEIKYAKTNLKPHNKLYYSLKENLDAIIISVDDDNVYSTKLVERLYNAYKGHPDCVCCNMAHEITLRNGKPDIYDNWIGGSPGRGGISNRYVALGVGGVLYPPKCFDEEYFDINLINELALTADDLWLKISELRLGIRVYKIAPNSKIPFTIGGSQKVTLGKENNGQKKNDAIMNKLCTYYRIEWNRL